MAFKSKLPQWIKYPLWWVFKAPQRKYGFYTVISDLLALVRTVNPFKPELTTISICVGLYNRSETFLQYFLPSIAQCENAQLIELSVFDCGSEDAVQLEQEIRLRFAGKVIFKSESHPFSRAFAFNKAVRQSSSELVFLCDADFSIPRDIVALCNNNTRNKAFWFPIVFYLYKNKPEHFSPKNGEWMLWGGKGLVVCPKDAFERVGALNEDFTKWGGEDEEFWLRCYKFKQMVLRTKCKDLLHHWHPSLNPKYKKLEELSDMGLL